MRGNQVLEADHWPEVVDVTIELLTGVKHKRTQKLCSVSSEHCYILILIDCVVVHSVTVLIESI